MPPLGEELSSKLDKFQNLLAEIKSRNLEENEHNNKW